MSVKARMKVATVTDFGTQQIVRMDAVYSSDPTNPNYSFSTATPSALLEITITNPAAFGQFLAQGEYDLVFSPTATDIVADAQADVSGQAQIENQVGQTVVTDQPSAAAVAFIQSAQILPPDTTQASEITAVAAAIGPQPEPDAAAVTTPAAVPAEGVQQ